MTTEVVAVDPQRIHRDAIQHAASIFRHGGLVAFPTQTVYGLGADATNHAPADRRAERQSFGVAFPYDCSTRIENARRHDRSHPRRRSHDRRPRIDGRRSFRLTAKVASAGIDLSGTTSAIPSQS